MINMKQIYVGLETMVGLLVAELEYLQYKVSTDMNDMSTYYDNMTIPKVSRYITHDIMTTFYTGKDVTNETCQYVLSHKTLQQFTDASIRTAIVEAVQTALYDLQLLKFGWLIE